MFQIKLYKFDYSIKNDILVSAFPETSLYFFSNLPSVVGIGFDFNNNNLKKIAEKANTLGLEPIIWTAPKFVKLIESAVASDKKIIDISFTSDLEHDDQKDVCDNLTGNTHLFFVKQIKDVLKDNNTSIKTVSWFEGKESIKLSLWDNGILYINDGVEALSEADYMLSYAMN